MKSIPPYIQAILELLKEESEIEAELSNTPPALPGTQSVGSFSLRRQLELRLIQVKDALKCHSEIDIKRAKNWGKPQIKFKPTAGAVGSLASEKQKL